MCGEVPEGSVCTTNEVSALIEELQYTLGEGPCVDVYYQDRPVLEPDLAEPATPRWFAFTPLAVEAGVHFRFVVHQASGMVAAQLGVSVGEALLRLRAFAFAHDRLITEVAQEVVERRLRFDDHRSGAAPGR